MTMLSSLTNRIFFSSTLLATVSIGFAVYFVSTQLRREAEAELQRDLREAVTLVEQQRTSLFETFTRTATLIADLPKFKAIVETRDAPTIEPIARDYQQQAGSDLFLVTDPEGRALAALGGLPVAVSRVSDAPGILRARGGVPSAAFWPHPNGVLQVVSVPITIGLDRPELLGTLTIGYLLDSARAASFKALTGADVAFAIDGQVRASTLGPDAHARLSGLLATEMVPRTMIGSSEYAALVRALHAPQDDAAGSAVPIAIVLRSRTERMRTLSAIQTGLGLVALATILLAAAISYGVARTVTRPLGTITNHMREIASTGDLTRKLRLGDSVSWHDEDTRLLATTFNTLTDSVARFQREAAQRERLSSLGRLSTIIAHEIRNPLMIVKGALRQLRKEDATPEDIREAAADIDGETERLNRVVNDVLDFAKPIRFERATTDVNALCRDAVSAVAAAAGGEPLMATELDPAVPPLETDSEKLRTALVNLLTNARQAVVARGADAADAGPAVTLSTARLGDRRLTISIRDRGIGIGADDLPRIFDPYFTTRRTGTGLGLPIAKNIIDALGGTLTVASSPGSGTRIRIELGDAPAGLTT